MIGLIIAAIIAIQILVYFNLRSTSESETSVLLRMMTNYFQIMMTAAAFNLDVPIQMENFYKAFTFMGEIFEGVTNFDCFLYHIGAYESSDNLGNYYVKAIFITLLPILAMAMYAPVFYLISKVKRLPIKFFYKWMTGAFAVVVFTLHPTLTKFLFGLFNCIEVDTGEYWMRENLEIRCWTG